jgi:hypothetical protein
MINELNLDLPTEQEEVDINKELPVKLKVRCAGKKVGYRGLPMRGQKCGQVYLRIVANEDKANEMDKLTTKKECPICGCEEFETIGQWKVKADGKTIVIKKQENIW